MLKKKSTISKKKYNSEGKSESSNRNPVDSSNNGVLPFEVNLKLIRIRWGLIKMTVFQEKSVLRIAFYPAEVPKN